MKKPVMKKGMGAVTCYNPTKKVKRPMLKRGFGAVTCYNPSFNSKKK